MTDHGPHDVTLNTLHDDLQGVQDGLQGVRGDLQATREETRAGFADLKATLIAGFRGLPSRESSEEMVRLLRENNRLQEERFSQLDIRIREQHLETQQVLRVLAEGQRVLTDEVRTLAGEIRGLAGDIKALIARLDALIKGRGDGAPSG